MLRAIALLALVAHVHGGPSCDNEAGQVCPFSVGKEAGQCLQDPSKHQLTDIDGNPRELEPGEKAMELSADCLAFIAINAACDADITDHCSGNFFHGDTMACLKDWTKPEALTEACTASMPKAKVADAQDDADKAAWKAKRRAAREQAIKDIEKENAKNSKPQKTTRKKKASKEL